MKREGREINLLGLRPSRNAEWEKGEEGRVVVLVPKFRNPFLARWLMPRLSKPYFRVKLDEYGSFLWKQCDGATTVASMAEKMKSRFGPAAEPVEERIGKFLNKLEHGELVVIESSGEHHD